MKKTFLVLFLSLLSFGGFAQTVGDAWVSMPDSLVPYLSKSQKKELVDYVKMHVDPVVVNQLGDTTCIDTLTDSYLNVRLSKSSQIEIYRSVGSGNLAVVRTFYGPAADSEINFYSADWKPLTNNREFTASTARPDTMSLERYDELQRLLEPKMTEMHLASDGTLTATYSLPLLSKEQKNDVRVILKQRKYKLDF